MAWKEAWVTAAEDDLVAMTAIRLVKSLRRSLTNKKIVVVPGRNVSTSVKVELLEEFDAVLPLNLDNEIDQLPHLKFDEKVKLALHGLFFFERGVFLSASILVLHNVDFFFDVIFGGSILQYERGECKTNRMDLNSPVFAVVPSRSNCLSIKTRFMSKKPTVCLELEAAQSKVARLFDSSGLYIHFSTPKDITGCVGERDVRLVVLPKEIWDDGFVQWGNVGQETLETLTDLNLTPKFQKTSSVPLERMKEEPIAIIGMACRLPAANDVEEFWTLLMNKGDAIRKVPEWRWPEEQVKHMSSEARESMAGFLKCPVDEFDAKFFGRSPKEMEFTDPQQRLLLEVSWEALEDAAVDATSLKGTPMGIFTGTWLRDYQDLMNKTGFEEKEFFRSYIGNGYGATAGRMAHFYGTTGANISTESGCSSSSVAVGLACKSLRRKDTSMALACGVNLLLQPFEQDLMAAFCSKDGHSKTFDASADGFGRAEGCGVLVLKRMSDAVRDGDNVRAVIRGYGEAQEGPSTSLGTPTVVVEALAMTLALRDAEVEPREVSFVEAHGTGTPVGDPMEMEAIAQVYSKGRELPLVVTSVKTNVGHTESCSGITGIIKTVLALEREVLPPHRALETLNPNIDLSKTPAIIPLDAVPWPRQVEGTRIAGVSSFGITGTDTHVILQEAPLKYKRRHLSTSSLHVLALSARSEVALKELIKKYEDMLPSSKYSWSDVTCTANTGRAHFKDFRATFVAKDTVDFQLQVERQSVATHQCPSEKPKVVFLFTGQGSQYAGMAKELFDTSPEFRRLFYKCDNILLKNYDIDIKRALWDLNDPTLLNQTLYSQTAIFVVDFCLAELWKTWGVTPDVVVGHSLGEYAAACVAGILSLEDALKLVAERSRLIDKLPRGKMVVVNVDEKATRQLLKNAKLSIDIAAMNSPDQTTLAGTTESILALKTFCDNNNGTKTKVLEATHAFHSQMMDAALPQLRKVTQSVIYHTPTCTFISGMEGQELTSVDADYWVRHTRQPINFIKACEALKKDIGFLCVEVGPQPILSTFVARNLESQSTSTTLLPSLRRNQSDWRTMMESLARLYTCGVDVKWSGVYTDAGGAKVGGLPTYPFQRKKFWFEKPKGDGLLFSGNQLHPLLHFRLPTATPTRIFHTRLSLEKETYVKDHVVGKHVIFPAAGYIEMILAAGQCAMLAEWEEFRFPRGAVFMRDLSVEAPLGMAEKEDVDLQTLVAPPDVTASPDDSNWNVISVHRRHTDTDGNKSWVLHSNAKFSPFSIDSPAFQSPETVDVDKMKKSLSPVDMESFYGGLLKVGLNFGDTFRSIRHLWRGASETLAEVIAPPGDAFFVHPVIIDAMIQTLMSSQQETLTQLMVPVKIDHFTWFGTSQSTSSLYVHVDMSSYQPSAVLRDATGRKLAVIGGVTLVPTTVTAVGNALQSQKLVLPYLFEEEWISTDARVVNEESAVSKMIFGTSAGLSLLQFERDQAEPTDRETLEVKMGAELCALQGLHAFLELGWTSKLQEIVDVRLFVEKYEISKKNLLMTRRMFEILSQHTDFVDGGDFIFRVTRQLPSMSDVERQILELERSMETTLRVDVECVRSVAKRTAGVLRGQDSVLPVLFGEGRVAEKAYTQSRTCVLSNTLLVNAIKQLCDDVKKKSDSDGRTSKLRILEVGGGTGGSTRYILPALEDSGVEFSYTFTDISAGFFTTAEKTLSEWKGRLTFKVLDIEKDPKMQGFVHEDFDVVVATHVLHATRVMKETMSNVRNLLRPNGVALIVEAFEPQPLIDMIFGLVDGYWLFEDFDLRPYHCIVPEAAWSPLLSSSGFLSTKLLKVPGANVGMIVAQASSGNFEYSTPASQRMNTWVLAQGVPESNFISVVTPELKRQGRRVLIVDDVIDGKWKAEIESGRVEGIVFVSEEKNFDAEKPARHFLELIQTLLSIKMSTIPKVVVVTRGAVVVGDQSEAFPHSATLWGMSRTLRSENSNFRVVNVDLDPHDSAHVNVTSFLRLLWSAKYDFIALRDRRTFTARMKRWKVTKSPLSLPQDVHRFGLILPKTNAIADLQFGVGQRREVTGNHVEVKLRAAALNFKDLLSVLKPTKEFETNAAVGTDMAGVVTAVGQDVGILKVGDVVTGAFFQFGGLPSHIVVPEDALARIPSNLTFEDASTLPAVFSTAYHCFANMAQLRRGESVLIHTASGGVGIVAVQIAKDIGARIIATAGSRRKREYLRKVMGVENVFHSRDLTYREAVLDVTGGHGVDVVLNSLTGPGFKEATLDVCSKNCRFIEMSKLNVWSESDVRQLRPDVDYRIVDLTSVSPTTWKNLLSKLEELMARGKLFPLPYESFEVVDIRDALTHLQKARHIGKIVIRMPEDVDGKGERRHLLFNARSTYVITGGLGGIGLEAAKWMASEGAKFLLLCGRRLPSDNASSVIAELNATGKTVLAIQLDVGNYDDCRKLVESINNGQVSLNAVTFPPVRGIQHAAGCLSDAMFPNMTWAKYEETFNAKVRGAWNLHQLTQNANLPLEHFVLYSSVAATFGSLGQSNHVAGNAFLDALAHFRHARGLPATSVNWGQWGQVGVAADLELTFLTPFTPLQGFASLKEILRSHKPQVGVFEGDLPKLRIGFPWIGHGYANSLLKDTSSSGDKESVSITIDKFWKDVDGANGDPKATGLVLQQILTIIVTQILKLDASDVVDVDQSLQEMGLDSLMMVELKNILQAVLGSKVTLTANVLADANSIHKLAKKLTEMILEGGELSPQEMIDFVLSQTELPDAISARDVNFFGDLTAENVNFLVCGAVNSQLATSVLENLTRRSNVRKVVVLSPKIGFAAHMNNEGVEVGKSKYVVISTDEDSQVELGIPHSQYDKLALEIDAVVDIRLSSSQDESVSGIKREAARTRNVLEFACHRKLKLVIHVDLLLPQRRATDAHVLEETLPCGSGEELARYVARGYGSGQFVSEVLVEEASRRGVPCRVVRVPHLSGDSRTGHFQFEDGHIFTRYLQFLMSGKMPTVPVPFAVVPVDQAASLLLQVLWSTSTDSGSPNVFNVTNPHEYSTSDFVSVSEELGKPMRAVELKEFMEDNKNSLVNTVTYMFGDPLDFSNSNYSNLSKGVGEELIRFDNLRRVVGDVEGQVETPLGILRRDLTFAQDSGLFQKFLLANNSSVINS